LPHLLDGLQNFGIGVRIYAHIWQIKAYFVAKKLHEQINFDVFHHVTFANDCMASFIGALLPIPYIRGPGGGAHRVPKSFLREFPFKDRLAQYFRSITQWIFKHDPFFIIGQNRAKAILVCNKESFNALSKKWQKKAYLFPVNGISAEDFKIFNTKGKTKEYFSVITSGRLLRIKGFDLVIKAFNIFSNKVPDAKLSIIGSGPELKNLENLVSELRINDKIIFENWMPREKLLQRMLDCDIFLFPSLRDGGGNVVVEAMAAGKPVICFDLAGPGFHIDEKCGIKIKPENPEQAVKEIAAALEKLYLDKELRDKLGKNAREKAEREYDWDKLGDKLNETYKKVL
jgi:glycosyltransferase involved in cell wall biosynthesis